jgi:hypothetical protein
VESQAPLLLSGRRSRLGDRALKNAPEAKDRRRASGILNIDDRPQVHFSARSTAASGLRATAVPAG